MAEACTTTSGASGALAPFLGAWSLERRILHADGQGAGRFEGTATLSPIAGQANTALYRERGLLHLPNAAPMHAERLYLWCVNGAQIDISFEDGRAFHSFDPKEIRPAAQHACPPDHYDVTYDFSAFDPATRGLHRWQSTWRVTGPRKSYTMVSKYLRESLTS